LAAGFKVACSNYNHSSVTFKRVNFVQFSPICAISYFLKNLYRRLIGKIDTQLTV
jgi:hypothetical protein